MSTVDRIGMARAKPVREFSHPKGGATAAPMTPRGKLAKGHAKGMLKSRRRELAGIESRIATEGETPELRNRRAHLVAVIAHLAKNVEGGGRVGRIKLAKFRPENFDPITGERLAVATPAPVPSPVPPVEPAETRLEPMPQPAPVVDLSVPLPAERARLEDVTYPSREGQQKFRADVLAAYGKCVVTGCQDEAALEAAHVIPYVDQRSNVIGNGICLRADIHRLYDRDLIRITPDGVVMVSKAVKSGPYRHLHGKRVAIDGVWPDQELMAVRHRYVGRLLAADDGRLTFA